MDRDEELQILNRALEHLSDKRLPLTDSDSRVGVERYQSAPVDRHIVGGGGTAS